jgi:hypothetical protein
MLGSGVLGVRQGGGDILLVEPGAVIALDQQRHATAHGQMPPNRNFLNSIPSLSSGEIAAEPGGPE